MHFRVTLDLYDVQGVVEARKAGIRWEGRECRCYQDCVLHRLHPPWQPPNSKEKSFPLKNRPARWEQRAHPVFSL